MDWAQRWVPPPGTMHRQEHEHCLKVRSKDLRRNKSRCVKDTPRLGWRRRQTLSRASSQPSSPIRNRLKPSVACRQCLLSLTTPVLV